MREWPFSYWFNQTKQGVANKLVIWLWCIGVTRMTKALDQISLQFHRYGKRAFGTWSTSGWFFHMHVLCAILPKDIYRLLQPLRTMDSIHIRYRKYTQYWHPCHQQSNGAESNFMLTALSCLGVGRGQQRHQLHSHTLLIQFQTSSQETRVGLASLALLERCSIWDMSCFSFLSHKLE